MAEVQSLSHSGICVHDLKEAEAFYGDVLGAKTYMANCFVTEDAIKGRSVQQAMVVEDYLFAIVLASDHMPMAPDDQHRGTAGFRHAFAVSRERFDRVMTGLKDHGVPYEGPVDHPERGPFGQSVYFKDPSGNFFEILWRRDEEVEYDDPSELVF